MAFLPLGTIAFPIVNLAISLLAVGSSVVYSVGCSVGIGAGAGTGTSVGASVGWKKGVGVIGLAGVALDDGLYRRSRAVSLSGSFRAFSRLENSL